MDLLLWLATAVLAALLGAIALTDMRSLRIPDALSLPLIPLGLCLAWISDGGGQLWLHPAGAIVGWGSFAALGAAFYRLRGVDGLGRGDAKLIGGAGAWLGLAALPPLVLMAALGALGYVWISGRDRHAPLAFGPWICAAFMALWLWRLVAVS